VDEDGAEYEGSGLVAHPFHGCLARVELNGRNLLEYAPGETLPCKVWRFLIKKNIKIWKKIKKIIIR
jgi:hypothetical protein